MNRKPSIHIHEDALLSILVEVLYVDLEPGDRVPKTLRENVTKIMEKARGYALDNRSIQVTNQKILKEVTTIASSSKANASLVAQTIYAVRISMKHKGVKLIKPSDKDWVKLKNISEKCQNFCEAFNLDIKSGTKEYITMVIRPLNNLRNYLNKCIDMYDEVCSQYQAAQEISDLGNVPDGTRLHDLYVSMVLDKTGITVDYTKDLRNFGFFLKAAKICNELSCEYETYLESQFEGLAWCNSIPLPQQLVSESARPRLVTYLTKYKINLGKEDKKVKLQQESFWKKFNSDEEE